MLGDPTWADGPPSSDHEAYALGRRGEVMAIATQVAMALATGRGLRGEEFATVALDTNEIAENAFAVAQRIFDLAEKAFPRPAPPSQRGYGTAVARPTRPPAG